MPYQIWYRPFQETDMNEKMIQDGLWVQDYGGHVYVVTRSDLSIEQQAVQGIHAAIDTTRSGLIQPNTIHPHLALCVVPNEEELYYLARKLDKHNIKFTAFKEPDRNNEITAIATEPLFGSRRNPLKNLKLLGA